MSPCAFSFDDLFGGTDSVDANVAIFDIIVYYGPIAN